jgi:hypothetical protein
MAASWHDFQVPPVPSTGGPSETRGGCAGQPSTPPLSVDAEPRVSLVDIDRAIRILGRIEKQTAQVARLLGGFTAVGGSPNIHGVPDDVFDRIPGVKETSDDMAWKRVGSLCIFRKGA